MFFIKRLLSIVLFFPCLSLADDFYYRISSGPGYDSGLRFSSPFDACDYGVSIANANNSTSSYEYRLAGNLTILGGGTGFNCNMRKYRISNDTWTASTLNLQTVGTCSYDLNERYECLLPEPEPDQCEAGNEIMRATYAVFGGSPNPPSLICSSSCEYNFKHLSGVGMSNPDKPDVFKYNAMYMSNGNNCESETPPETEPDQPPPEPEPGDPDYCPPGWSKGPDGSTCFRNPDNPDPGGDGGGSDGGDNGGSDGGDNGSGGDGGTGGDGGGSDGGNNGDGGSGGNGGSGGDNGSGGDGGTGGDGDGGSGGTGGTGGSGDGNGDGEGEEKGEGKYSGGADCQAAPECSGDAIQCGIVDQQWRMRCDFEKAYDYEGNKDKIEGLLDGEKFELLESGDPVEVPSFLNMHARWLGSSSCPSDETISLRTGGGRTFSLSYEPLCTAATTISPLLIIIATVLATLYIGRGSEG